MNGRTSLTRTARAAVLLAGAVAALWNPWAARGTQAQEPRLLAEQSAGIVPVAGERRLVVRGVRGVILIQAGKAPELRFVSVDVSTRRSELPLAVWLEGNSLRLEPPAGSAETGRFVEVAIPADFDVSLDVEQAKVAASGLSGSFEVDGRALDVELRGLGGPVLLDVDESKGVIEDVGGDVTLRGSEVQARVKNIAGNAFVRTTGGTVELRELRGAFSGDVDGVTLEVVDAHGPLELKARGGKATVTGARAGAEISLTGTPLQLERCAGDITVQSDTDVRFQDMQASLHFDSYGGSLRGSRNDGLLEVRTRAATIALEGLSGPTRIQGDGLGVALKDVQGDTEVYLTTSDVKVEGSSGKLVIESDRGSVRVTGASGPVEVRGREGDVQVLGAQAPLQVEADGRQVEVSWTKLAGDTDSLIRNLSGDVTVRFPATGGCRVEAETRFGRVESDLPKVRVLESGRSAEGNVGTAARPLVRVESAGDVFLTGGSQKQEEGS